MKKLIPLAILLASLSACKKVEQNTNYDEWCIKGVTYYHFDRDNVPYAAAPAYDHDNKTVIPCEEQSSSNSDE